MEEIAIAVKGLGKCFYKNSESQGLFSQGFKEGNSFWALKDVNFEIEKGKGLGVIGGNGSGKSTLLKILSKIIPPTTGEAIIDGKVNSLLEVGTGFQRDLSGKANIYLNASILGMTKEETDSVYNDIVEFSGIGNFIEMPVKHYSSGMYSRLAFSVAAHVTGDILLLDEVLSVGDAEFRQKCLTRMNGLLGSDHKTVLFVSHSMEAVMRFCSKALWLDKGVTRAFGDSEDVIQEYLKSVRQLGSKQIINSTKISKDTNNVENITNGIEIFSTERISGFNDAAIINKVLLTDQSGVEKEIFKRSEEILIMLFCEVFSDTYNINAVVHFHCHPRKGISNEVHVFTSISQEYLPKERGKYKCTICIPPNLLATGYYSISLALNTFSKPVIKHCKLDKIATIYIIDTDDINFKLSENIAGVIYPKLNWKIVLVDDILE